jgi:ribonuclease HI
MELTAVIEALDALQGPSEVEAFTESEHVRKGITESIHTWKKAWLEDRCQAAGQER